MGANDLYEVEMITNVHGIFCRNVFHFIPKFPTADSTWVVDQFKTNFVEVHKHVFSAYATYVEVKAKLMNDPVADSYSFLYEGDAGLFPAESIDPRLCLYVRLWGTPNRGQHSQGGLYFSGVTQDIAQQQPRVSEVGLSRWQQILDAWVAFFGFDSGASLLKWVILSKRIKDSPNMTILDYTFPVREARIRGYLASLRSRRPRGPF